MKTKQTHHGRITFKHVMDMYEQIIKGNNDLFKNHKLFAQSKKQQIILIESRQTRHNYSYRKRRSHEEIAQNKQAQKELRSIADLLPVTVCSATMYVLPKKILGLPVSAGKKIEIKQDKPETYQVTITSDKDITAKVYEILNS